MYHKTTGIVLTKEIISESDKLLHIYTLEMGRITAISKGAKRLHAKMLAATEPVTETEFMFHFAADHSIPRIIGGEIKNTFPDLKKNLKRYSMACRVVEIVDTLTARYDQNPGKYDLLRRTIELLENANYPERIYLAFVLRFMKLCGYEPRLFKCIKCGASCAEPSNKRTSTVLFSLKEKGILCIACSEKINSTISKLPNQVLSYIQKLSRLSGREIDELERDQSMDNSVIVFVESYMQEFLPYQLKTQDIFSSYVDVQLKTL